MNLPTSAGIFIPVHRPRDGVRRWSADSLVCAIIPSRGRRLAQDGTNTRTRRSALRPGVDPAAGFANTPAISTLAEIKAAADTLPPEQKQELILFLATRLRSVNAKLPEPRKFSREQIEAWIADDEEGMRRFRAGK